MDEVLAFIGFGEAGRAFANAGPARGFDVKLLDPNLQAEKHADFERASVRPCESAQEALAAMPLVLSLVTADQALAAAQASAPLLMPGALWMDMNSVAPETKCAAAQAISDAGGRYVDAAVMAPVAARGLATPILLSGPHASSAAEALGAAGFGALTVIDGGVGIASSIKMIRSVLVKGLEAVTAECFLAAEAAGITATVAQSLAQDWPGIDWVERADYNLERMMTHGVRRAAEMEEVARTLDALGVGSVIARASAQRQREIGGRGLTAPHGLAAKAAAILGELPREAA